MRFRFASRLGRHRLGVRFYRRARLVARDGVRDVWVLPRSAQRARRERAADRRLAASLGRLGRDFPGYAAFWVHDLTTGRTAGWNSDALFPAASTVKLGVLLAALRRFGPNPERTGAWRDIRDLATWSSNIASNRLLLRLGGSEARGAQIAQAALWRAGARSSTFTGNYRLGTAVGARAGDTPKPLPLLTYRRTTAHDLGRILFELHAAALGNRLSLRRTGTTLHTSRLALGLLLSSDPNGDNRGLLRPALGHAIPIAQKQGWTTSLRHTAAIVYGRRGPKIVVLLTYRSGMPQALAASLGARLVRAMGS
ncbi:MAG: serine hydrolase [Actinobacteria bacterium]|nr:serine hydrolase [Actinomycetota bacterium]